MASGWEEGAAGGRSQRMQHRRNPAWLGLIDQQEAKVSQGDASAGLDGGSRGFFLLFPEILLLSFFFFGTKITEHTGRKKRKKSGRQISSPARLICFTRPPTLPTITHSEAA